MLVKFSWLEREMLCIYAGSDFYKQKKRQQEREREKDRAKLNLSAQ